MISQRGRRGLAAAAILAMLGLLLLVPVTRDGVLRAQSANGSVELITGTTHVAYLGPALDLPGALGEVSDSVPAVWRFDAFADPGASPWQLWSATLPASLQGFQELLFGEAYFVVSDETVRWPFAEGEAPATPLSVLLAAGGNSVVYFGETLPVEQAIVPAGVAAAAVSAGFQASQAGTITSIWELVEGAWSLWSSALPPALQGIDSLSAGRPYFVTTSAAFEWLFPQSGTPPVDEPPVDEPPVEEPSPELSAFTAELRALVGSLLSEEEIALVAAGMRERGTQTFFDRLPALEDPSLEIALSGVFEFTLDAAEIAALLGGLGSAQVTGPMPPAGERLNGRYMAGFLWLSGPPTPGNGIEPQLGLGVSQINGLNTTPDPFAVGAGHLGLNRFGFISGIPGWVTLTMLDAVNQFRPLPTDGFGYVGQSRLAMFFVPIGEVPVVTERIGHFVNFGRKTDGQPVNDQQQARTTTTTILERPFGLDPAVLLGDPWQPAVFPGTEIGERSDVVSLRDDRFAASMVWTDPSGTKRPVQGGLVAGLGGDELGALDGSDTGLFFFSDADNWELLVKVLDGCGFNGHFWVFAAATTNVEYTLTVTDTQSGSVNEFHNPLGQASPAILDTSAFATCP